MVSRSEATRALRLLVSSLGMNPEEFAHSLGEDRGSHAVSKDEGNGNSDSEGREVEIVGLS